jgi:competence protein ComEC
VPLPAAGALLSGFGLCWLCLWRTAWRFAGVPILALGLSAGAWQRPPDLLVSGDSRWILVRLAEGAYAERGRGAVGFQREAMLRAWALAAAAPLPRGGEAAGGAIRCDAAACRISLPGGEVLLLRPRPGEERPMLAPERCAGAVLVVSAAPLRGRCPGVAVLDRFSTWREGAHAVRLEGGGARVLSDRSLRGERPWVPPPPRPRAPAQPGEAPPPPEEPPEEAADQ